MKSDIKSIIHRILILTLVAGLPLAILAGLIWDPLTAFALLLGILLAAGGFLVTLLMNLNSLEQDKGVLPVILIQFGKVLVTALAAYFLISQRVNLGLFFFAGYALVLFGISMDQMRGN